MLFYHGTTLKAALSIKKTGLMPHRTSAYQLISDEGRNMREAWGTTEMENVMYLTDDQKLAKGRAVVF